MATVTTSRRFDIPAAELFRAWLDPKLVAAWWGPEGFEIVVSELDARVGGAFRFEMVSPSGSRGAMAGVYREIVDGKRLVFELTEHCNCDLPEGAEPQLERAEVSVEFQDEGDATLLRLTHRGLGSPEIAARIEAGWGSGFDALARSAGV